MSFDSRLLRPAVLAIGEEHYETHARNLFTISKTNRTVPNNNYVYYRIKPVDKECHIQINWSSEGKGYLRTYSIDTAFPLVSTAITPFNRVIGSSRTATTLCYTLETATANVLGTLRGDDAIGASGAAPSQAGGASGGRLETVIPPGHEFLIEIQNVRGSAGYINVILNFYEQVIS
jgi:hypothetical protein